MNMYTKIYNEQLNYHGFCHSFVNTALLQAHCEPVDSRASSPPAAPTDRT